MLLEHQRFPIELDSITKAIDFIASTCNSSGVRLPSLPNLLLACDELLANIYLHGCHMGSDEIFVDITICFEANFLCVRLEDNSCPFDPQHLLHHVDFHPSTESLENGGLGIYLLSQVLDCFEHHEEDSKNINVLKIHADRTASEDWPK